MADNMTDHQFTMTAREGETLSAAGGAWHTLLRILRLWRMYAALDAAFVAADLKLVLIYLFSDAITNIALVMGMLLLAERFAGIGPWSRDQVFFLLGYATTVGGLLYMFFGYNVLMISRRIGRGQLDHTLVQPQPLWISILTEGFNPLSGSATLVPGVGLMVWGAAGMGLQVTPGWVALLVLNIVASMACVLSVSFLWSSLAFWAPRAAEEISSSAMHMLDELKTFPLDGLGPLLLGGLMTIAPVGFVAWYPCRALLGIDQSPMAGWITPLAGLLLFVFMLLVFRKGLHHYGRTGSQRYSNFGHRG
jgi:ABC-2 type transport system permease protein